MMKRRFFKGLAVLSATLAMTFSPAPAEAFIPSIKGLGIAAAGTAYPQDAETGAYNPANITEVGDRADVGMTITRSDGYTTAAGFVNLPSQNGTFNAYVGHYRYNPHLGVTKQIYRCGKHFAAGLVLYNNAEAFSKYGEPFPVLGTSNLKLNFIEETIALPFAYEICPGHSIGVAVNVYFSRLKITGLENFDTEDSSTVPGLVTNNGPSVAEGVGVSIGYLGHFGDCFSIGFSYSPETDMTRLNRYKGFIAQKGKLNVPQRIAGGIAVKVLPCLHWVFDIVHVAYNKIPALHNPLVIPANLGADNGAAFGWRDRVFFRTGFDYQVNDRLNVRLGFRHARTPIPADLDIGAANILLMETIQDIITTGFTYRINCRAEFSFYYAHGFKHTVNSNVPILLNPPAPPGVGGATLRYAQSKDAFGFGLGYYY